MREDLLHAKETIVCTAILHNIAIKWGDEVPPLQEGEVDDPPPHDDEDGQEYVINADAADR
jgi:hypothetical protein